MTDGTTVREPFSSAEPSDNTTYIWDPVDMEEGTFMFAELEDSVEEKATTIHFEIRPGDGGCLGTVRPSRF